jgi:Fe2+ or Zn2+ uptake regulation protein
MSATATGTSHCSPNLAELSQAIAVVGRHPGPARVHAAAVAALEQFRGHGHRSTPACRHILHELASVVGHRSAEELFAALPVALTRCDRSTIHRQLAYLQNAGVVHAVPAARATTFGLSTAAGHNHESCLRCGRTIDISHDLGGRTRQPIPALLTSTDTSVAFGICTNCPGYSPASARPSR